jgi:hypothetical protein
MTMSTSPAILLKRKWKLVQCAAKLKRKRKPNVRALIKEAEKGGKKVSGAVIEDGKIELKFGKQDADDTAAANEWDEVYGKDKAPTRQ